MLERSTQVALVVIAVFGGVSPWIADYNASHIFNPNWPPHAVFHSGQVLVFTSLSSALAILFLTVGGPSRLAFAAGWALTAVYWLSLSAAVLVPGAAWLDPEYVDDPTQYIAGVPGNAFVCLIIVPLLFLVGGLGLWSRRDVRWTAQRQSATAVV